VYRVFENGKVLGEAEDTQYTYESRKLLLGSTFEYYVSLTTPCGTTRTPPQSVKISGVPDKMAGMKWVRQGCGFKFSWTPPGDNGSPIKEYLVTLSSVEICVTQHLHCTVNLEQIKLKEGEIVTDKIQVMAVNGEGISLPSEYDLSNSLTLLAMPDTPKALEFTKIATNSIKLNWVNVSPTTNQIFKDGKLLGQVSGTSFIIRNLKKETQYTMQVIAVNACGKTKSQTLSVRLGRDKVPPRMGPVTTKVRDCDIAF
jgi:hypothetical protein